MYRGGDLIGAVFAFDLDKIHTVAEHHQLALVITGKMAGAGQSVSALHKVLRPAKDLISVIAGNLYLAQITFPTEGVREVSRCLWRHPVTHSSELSKMCLEAALDTHLVKVSIGEAGIDKLDFGHF
ncbi:hypothetical protein [Tritonibacter mobilis]|uniref:hypothetical protein n=1 Tax=Tritonibacter mobilis TaxID=379347 RepID=UPI001D0D0F78|nr:hypothetical protein [Tritonibacter mobilis]